MRDLMRWVRRAIVGPSIGGPFRFTPTLCHLEDRTVPANFLWKGDDQGFWSKRLYGKSRFHKMTGTDHLGGLHAGHELAA